MLLYSEPLGTISKTSALDEMNAEPINLITQEELPTIGKVNPNTIIRGDCLEVMRYLDAGSIDAIITDLPYGTTACKWDTIIPFAPMWKEVKRVLKPNGAFITSASQPFTSALVMSNPSMFKCEWIWEKNVSSNFMQYKFLPAKRHENILVFAKGKTTYNPIMEDKSPLSLERMKYKFHNRKQSEHYKTDISEDRSVRKEKMYPTSIKKFNREVGLHPTQKPVSLYEYLIRTYTNEGDTVLDMTMGSGTTGAACYNTGRYFIGIEKDPAIFETARARLEAMPLQLMRLR